MYVTEDSSKSITLTKNKRMNREIEGTERNIKLMAENTRKNRGIEIAEGIQGKRGNEH